MDLFQFITKAPIFIQRIPLLSCAFPTHYTCVEFKLRIKRESTYFQISRVFIKQPLTRNNDKVCVFPLANHIVWLKRSDV